jgi:hypothetical protein
VAVIDVRDEETCGVRAQIDRGDSAHAFDCNDRLSAPGLAVSWRLSRSASYDSLKRRGVEQSGSSPGS